MQVLLDRGISTRRGVMNAHVEPAYDGRGNYSAIDTLSRSIAAQESAIMLPLYVQMSEADVAMVVSELKNALTPAVAAA
jgi:dTDP-4-amino-4,6-dideoxygalactose transaminase